MSLLFSDPSLRRQDKFCPIGRKRAIEARAPILQRDDIGNQRLQVKALIIQQLHRPPPRTGGRGKARPELQFLVTNQIDRQIGGLTRQPHLNHPARLARGMKRIRIGKAVAGAFHGHVKISALCAVRCDFGLETQTRGKLQPLPVFCCSAHCHAGAKRGSDLRRDQADRTRTDDKHAVPGFDPRIIVEQRIGHAGNRLGHAGRGIGQRGRGPVQILNWQGQPFRHRPVHMTSDRAALGAKIGTAGAAVSALAAG